MSKRIGKLRPEQSKITCLSEEQKMEKIKKSFKDADDRFTIRVCPV